MLEAASQENSNHPGFIVLDEPYQQNPDDFHKLHLAEFFKYFSKAIGKRQAIIFTSLPSDERDELKATQVNISEISGEHFLNLFVPAEEPVLRSSAVGAVDLDESPED
jgi:hypothetical protein